MPSLSRSEVTQKLLASLREFRSTLPGRPLPTIATLVRRVIGEGTHLDDANDLLVLEVIDDLFRAGILGWGATTAPTEGGPIPASGPPFFHVTQRGRQIAAKPSRDPSDRYGYVAALRSESPLDSITESYVVEALEGYNAGCFKSAAVMIGGASERLILNLRDVVVARLNTLGKPHSSRLSDWRIKTVRDDLTALFGHPTQQAGMSGDFRPRYAMYWPSLSESLRQTRNAAGHPTEIDPIGPELAHGNLLIFPLFAGVVRELSIWAGAHDF
jgi:hypothetical protein